ncbi:MAG TPA: hypothetical protein VM848_04630 [Acidimicrobiia bacterium]|nr:hypothetical protein [Acidimicrobiia bacterium]
MPITTVGTFSITGTGVGTAFGEDSEAGRFCRRIGEAWGQVRVVSHSTEAAPLDGAAIGKSSSFIISKGENLSDGLMRFMSERRGDQSSPPESVPVEIHIGKNANDRFPVVILGGGGGWFDVEMTDRSYLSIRPPMFESPPAPALRPPTSDELRDGAGAVCEAYRMLNEAIERLHSGEHAADRPALNSFAETALARTRALYTFLYRPEQRDYVVAAHYIGELSKQLLPLLALPKHRDPSLIVEAISTRVSHITFKGASSKHEYWWEPRSLFKVVVDGMDMFIGHLEAVSPQQASWFRPTHEYVVSRKAYEVPMAMGRIEYAMTTTTGLIMTTLGLGASNRFHEVGDDYYRREVPPF